MSHENYTKPMTIEADTEAKAPAQKRKGPRQSKPAGVSKSLDRKAATPKTRGYSPQERLEKINLIESQVASGTSTIKSAVKSAGISEQTYYQWKRNAKPVDAATENSASSGDQFTDLIQLEAENEKLRKLLAEKLRTENSELRKRLGLE